jgi:hypothetical protein
MFTCTPSGYAYPRLNIGVEWVCQTTVAIAEARVQLGNAEKGERPPLEAVTRGLVKARQAQKS